MKHLDVSYVDLANIAEIILKGGTVVEDNKKYIMGFGKDIDIPVLLELDDKAPSSILVSPDLDIINEKIIDFYMKGGIYVGFVHNSENLFSSFHGARISLFTIGK